MAVPPGSPALYYSCRSLDGQLNATLVDGDPVDIVVNLGSLGAAGDAEAVETAVFVNGITPALRSDGTAYYQTPELVSPLAQANLIVAVYRIDQPSGSVAICDGLTALARNFLYDNGVTVAMAAGSFPGNAPSLPSVRGSYNYVSARFDGASSSFVLNGTESEMSATVGTQAIGGMTLMAAADGTLGIDGDLMALLVWSGTLPTQLEIANWVDAEFQVGWPRPYMTRASYPAFVGTPGLTVPAEGDFNVVFFGDSITAATRFWYDVPDGFVEQLNAVREDAIIVAASGVGGSTIAPFTGESVLSFWERLPAVIAANPDADLFVIEGGVNDTVGGALTGGTPLTDFWNYGRAIVKRIRRDLPDCRIAWVNILCRGEMYPDPLNPMISQYNDTIAAICQLYGATLADARTDQQAYEAEFNTPAPGAGFGVLTSDGVHTGEAPDNPAGAVLMGTATMERVTVT